MTPNETAAVQKDIFDDAYFAQVGQDALAKARAAEKDSSFLRWHRTSVILKNTAPSSR